LCGRGEPHRWARIGLFAIISHPDFVSCDGVHHNAKAGRPLEGHEAGRHIGYRHLEKLHNLAHRPSTGFTVSCFPVKIERASAG